MSEAVYISSSSSDETTSSDDDYEYENNEKIKELVSKGLITLSQLNYICYLKQYFYFSQAYQQKNKIDELENKIEQYKSQLNLWENPFHIRR